MPPYHPDFFYRYHPYFCHYQPILPSNFDAILRGFLAYVIIVYYAKWQQIKYNNKGLRFIIENV